VRATLWRYRELLPYRDPPSVIELGETMTPLIDLPSHALRFDLDRLIVKDVLAALSLAREQRWLAPGAAVVLFNCAGGYKYPLPGEARTLDRHSAIDYASL